jgi:hypothetical protein
MEVKSGTNKSIQSLGVFEANNENKLLFRTSPHKFVKSDNFINIPLYRLF